MYLSVVSLPIFFFFQRFAEIGRLCYGGFEYDNLLWQPALAAAAWSKINAHFFIRLRCGGSKRLPIVRLAESEIRLRLCLTMVKGIDSSRGGFAW